MTKPTIESITEDLKKEIEPYARDMGLYALSVAQVLFVLVQVAKRAGETGNPEHQKIVDSLSLQLIQNHPEAKHAIRKYIDLLHGKVTGEK